MSAPDELRHSGQDVDTDHRCAVDRRAAPGGVEAARLNTGVDDAQSPAIDPGPFLTADDVGRALGERLSRLWPGPVTVRNPTRLSGGANRETWALDAGLPDGTTRALILRRDPGTFGSAPLTVEAAAIDAATKAGVPGPAVHDVAAGHPELGDYLLMDRVDGETIPRRILRDPALADTRRRLAGELGGVLARIHAATPDATALLPQVTDPLATMVEAYAGTDPVPPGLALGLRWLDEHRPVPGTTGLAHGDFRLGNLMIGPDGVRAVLDWELVHLGDQLVDLGWLCAKVWRFGSDQPVGGLGPRSDLLDGYAAVAGWRPDEEQLRWWELFATVTWGLMCRVQAGRHLSGAERSVELAAIGRRACEQEFDVLLALGLAEPEPALDVLSADHAPTPDGADRAPGEAPHGGPTLPELLEAVSEYLREDVVRNAAGRTGFHGRVAANVVDMARRQLLLGPTQRAAHRTRLDALGCTDDAALSTAISSGSLDGRRDEVVDAVRASVRDRLLVANPRHLALPS